MSNIDTLLFGGASEACNGSSYSERSVSLAMDIVSGSFYGQALRMLQSEINFDTEWQSLLEKAKLEHYKE